MSKKNLKNKLKTIEKQSASAFSTHLSKQPSTTKTPKLPSRYKKMAEIMGGELVTTESGSYVLLKKTYPIDFHHGKFRISEVGPEPMPLGAFTLKGEDELIDPKDMLFIDTETTGLGGSGAVAFLIGCGSVVDKGFEVRQYLIPDYDDEAAVLEDLQNEFHESKSLVSYNGATFDLPLLLDRMIINRVGKTVIHQYHIDLLHSARRLFKRRLASCRLGNIESELLLFDRIDDLPGYLVPSVYFEWLNSESLELMEGVIEHNRLDIVSLYFIARLVSTVYQSEGESLDHIDDLHSLSKFYSRKKQSESTTRVIEKIEEISTENLDEDIVLFQADNYKRRGDYDKAESLWCKISNGDSKESYKANVELAKYYEHKKKNYQLALVHTNYAGEICPYGRTHSDSLKKRLHRLKMKQKKYN